MWSIVGRQTGYPQMPPYVREERREQGMKRSDDSGVCVWGGGSVKMVKNITRVRHVSI